MAAKDQTKKKKKHDRVSMLLYAAYLATLVIGVLIVYKIINIQLTFNPPQRILNEITVGSKRELVEPARGQILARDGRVLAMSYTSYTIAMDCTVRYEANKNDGEEGQQREKEWREKARGLAEGLALYFPKYTAQQYYNTIISKRVTRTGYWCISTGVGHETMEELLKLPLFNEPKYKGGLIVQAHNVRKYPYGSLGRRTIGLVNNNAQTSAKSHYGLEGKFEHQLHGTSGYEWMRLMDGRKLIRNNDSTYVAPIDGQDVRSTLDVDIQFMLDEALRSRLAAAPDAEGGCAMVMDVKTGAIRAMVNLRKDSKGVPGETYNYCIGRVAEPGSIFKTVGLTTLIEDGYVKSLNETMPCNRGNYMGFHDEYIPKYEAREKKSSISIGYGLKISSNMVFRVLVNENYKRDPQKFLDRLADYKLGEAFDFDISGLLKPTVPVYRGLDGKVNRYWSNTDLPSIAIGYNVMVTPLHMITFYNAIAAKGKMMRPYLVESLERDGQQTELHGPSVLNPQICSERTAEIVTKGLLAVTQEEHGTAYNAFKGCPVKVAGKTGTSRQALDKSQRDIPGNAYQATGHRIKHVGTFVGFFPADDPQYTILCTVYGKFSTTYFYGGDIPARTVREVVDGLYCTDKYWQTNLEAKGTAPTAYCSEPIEDVVPGQVPNVKGKGLSEAVWILENAGYKCSTKGTGHVAKQTPEAGSKQDEGTTISIELQ